MQRPVRNVLAAAIVLSAVAVAQACNVPVFRFALEHWRPDAYRMTVFHRGPLSEKDRALLLDLETQQGKSQLPVNLVVKTLDVSALDDDADRKLFETLGNPELPWFFVQYPAHLQISAPVWSGALSRDVIGRLSDSPLRQELVRRLIAGQTAVWLLLECGQATKDDAAARLVEEQIKKLVQELKLPELTDAPDDKLLTKTPLEVAFSLLRVPRSDAEQPLVKMLLHSEPDLPERSDPMVFPVFGRGRALLPLVGAGVTAENIRDSASFLVGACSCEVKEQNPGFDLLLSADWESMLTESGVPLPDTAASPGVTSPGTPQETVELVPIPNGSRESTPSAPVAETSPTQHPVPAAAPLSTAETGIAPKLVLIPAMLLALAACLAALRSVNRRQTQ